MNSLLKKTHTYLFSIIIPAYNCADYIDDAIVSILDQSIGFKDYVELVLVNDGSVDGTDKVCQLYQTAYPDNVVYIKQDNAGASAARLAGLLAATGQYVNFLDADDFWSLDVCKSMAKFFEKHPDISICTARHEFFGAKIQEHPLSYKYEHDAIYRLDRDTEYPQLSLSNAFVRRELVRPEYFDNRLKVSEDFLVINRILFETMAYGALTGPTYYYRRRLEGGSAIDGSYSSLSWYTETPRYCYQALFDESQERFGCILPHVQHSVMYDMQWRIKEPATHPLDTLQLEQYREQLVSLLERIDDSVICAQRHLDTVERVYALALKRRLSIAEFKRRLSLESGSIWIANPGSPAHKLFKATELGNAIVDFIREDDDSFVFEGRIDAILPSNRVRVFARSGSEEFPALLQPRLGQPYSSFFDKEYDTPISFEIRIPRAEYDRIDFSIKADGQEIPLTMRAAKFCKMTIRNQDYCLLENHAVYTLGRSRQSLKIVKRNAVSLLKREIALEAALAAYRYDAKHYLGLRRECAFRRINNIREKSSVWLISDRPSAAGDNGEALFTYLMEHPLEGVNPYFVIRQDSPDFQRMAAIGPVVPYDSRRHLELHMKADIIASSAADDFVFIRLENKKHYLKNFEHYKFVFLQHGITKDDMSTWLNRYRKNISLFVTASSRERDSIVGNPVYGYLPENIVLTGFPRHDALLSKQALTPTQKRILVAPTWRENLAGNTDTATGKRRANPNFESSDYYRFYQGLLNNEKLISTARELGYSIDFLIHPSFAVEAPKFSSPYCTILEDYNYSEAFLTSAIMVTDFSSVAFDFALLRKPLIYAQFDSKTFYKEHAWGKGYFSYENDGFGDIVHSLDETVEAIIGYMKKPCMPSKYLARVNDFFDSSNNNRCETLIEAILNLLKV